MNTLLQQAETEVESKLTPETRDNFNRIVVAGLHAGLDKGADGILASLRQSKDPISDAAKGAVAMILILQRQAHGVMPRKAAVPAAMVLMLKALDFADRAGIVKVGNTELIRATHVFTDAILTAFGVKKADLSRMIQRTHAVMNDPEAMRKVNMKAGVVAHPGAEPAGPPPA